MRCGAAFLAEPFAGAARTALLAELPRLALMRFGEIAFVTLRLPPAALEALTALPGLAALADSRRRAPAWAAVLATAAGFAAGVAFAATLAPAGAGAAAELTAGAGADVLPFGRPPLRANCASANILRKAS